jgi:hypothetical protein
MTIELFMENMRILSVMVIDLQLVLSRFLSMFVVMFLKPKRMLIMSITGCLFATTIISLEGGQNSLYLFIGAALYGLAVSWHFGAGVSWTAENMDVVVRKQQH